jgi:adenine deaminase
MIRVIINYNVRPIFIIADKGKQQKNSMYSIKGQLVDILQGKISAAEVLIDDTGTIASVTPLEAGETGLVPSLPYILPGFIDAHVHIESSLLIPSEFARLAVVHGTVATVNDPHEIANVCGLPGVEFMIFNGGKSPFHFNFGAPSCVPATLFETAGARLDSAKVEELLKSDPIKYLSEMMNYPGVLNKDPEVMEKIAAAQRLGKPVDGHAPGLRGEQARAYIEAGISTDHECFTAEEALEKLNYGMKILIREGSAAKNFDALIGLLNDYPDRMMFCSDDKHPDSLVAGHINQLCARAVARGIDVFKVLKAACLNPVLHYNLDSGLLRPGDPADLILVEDLQHFKVLQTYIKGILVAENGNSLIPPTYPRGGTNKSLFPGTGGGPSIELSGGSPAIASAGTSGPGLIDPLAATDITHPSITGPSAPQAPINNFHATPRTVNDFAYLLDKWGEEENVEQVYVIEALDGQLITNRGVAPIKDVAPVNGLLQSNPGKDLLKVVVVNRYQDAPVAKSFIRGFGLKTGAIASSVAHDSHNIIAVGVDDESICRAVNLVIGQKGGLSCSDGRAEGNAPASSELILPLPVAGLMSMDDGYLVAEAYTAIDAMAKSLGSALSAPFMTLSFMALLVIPHLKLGDLGLFDGDAFRLL